MSEEDNSNESSNNEEDEEGEEEEDDEGEEEEDDEGEEEEDDEEGEEEEDDEGEEEEDDEDDDSDKKGKKKKKKDKKDKKKEKDKKNKKKGKENSEEIIPKKTTIQLLMEISTEMDTLSSHMETALPIRKITYTPTTNNIANNPMTNSYSIIANIDKDDLEIKNLIEKANQLTNNSKNIKKEEEIKTYEDKGCQSEDEIENDGENEDKGYQDYYNNNGNKFPYDPNKHLEYYKDLQINKQVQTNSNNINTLNNINNTVSHNDTRVKKMEDLYNRTNSIRRQPIIYTQPETSNRNINLNNNYNQLNYIN